MPTIYCVPLDGFPVSTMADLARIITRQFQRQVIILPELNTTSSAYDPARGQHNSTAILQMLAPLADNDLDRVLGVTTADLFIPIFTYLFGEAQLDGPAAVVSGMRLQNQFYGLASEAALYNERLQKECLHELGHTFGLRHCITPGCVMLKSTYVENIDLKSADFCSNCSTSMGALENQ
ncbi:archaemetzincin family Zn-dependent metalloprotease [Candidatus Neomarinimicrobiota bacterium]